MTKPEDIRVACDSLETIRDKVAGGFYGDRGVFHAIVHSVEKVGSYFHSLAETVNHPAIGQEHPWYAFGAKQQTRDATKRAQQILGGFSDTELREYRELASDLAERPKAEYLAAAKHLFSYKENSDGRGPWKEVPFDNDPKLRLYVELSQLVEDMFEPFRKKEVTPLFWW